MAYPANERGIGGKFTRRTSARTPSTPYDRPPTALRGVRGGGQVAGERGGWMSKLLDPASRLIASGASKLFASMFRKRLTAPPLDSGISDKDLHPEVDVSRHASTHLLSETRNGDIHNGGYNVDNQTNGLHNGGSSVDNQKNSSGCDIVDLEQLLKQKTFTMVEFNHLEELLRSRTVESSSGNNDIGGDKKGKSVVLASDDIPGSSKVHKMFHSNGLASQSQIPMTEASSPAEVAKAYMVSRPNKEISLSGSLRDQAFHEGTKLRSMGSDLSGLNLSVAPRSVIRLSGVPEQHQYQNYAYQTTKLVGKSAMYRMSRSPYFKVNRAASTQIGDISRNDHSSPVSSQWKSRGKQALKRGISALDDEYGSFGPIRRIRQKSNLVSPSRNYDSSASMQKSLYLEGRKYDSTSSENAEHETENSAVLPEQSSEKAHKLFQQLDKLLPSSPIKRPSELKATTIDESPSKLTLDMLHGRALKSTEDIGRSNFLSTHEVGKSAIASSQQNAVNSQSTRESRDEKSKLPQNHAYNGMDVKTPQANDVSKITLSSKNVTKPAPVIQKTPASSSVSVPKSKAPSFRISALEDSFDLDDDEDDNANRLSVPSTLGSTTKISAQNGTCSKASSENPISSLVLSKKDEKDAIPPVLNKKENEFVFPVAANPSTQSQPPPTPCMPTPTPSIPTPRFNTQIAQEETEQYPIPSPESKDVKLSTNDAGVKVGEELRSETTLTTGNSKSTATNSANESTMVQSEVPKTDDAPKAPSAASESSTTSTPFFSFGASSSSSLSNGSINPSPNDNPLPSNSIIGNSTTTNSISNISSVSSAAATFSTTAPTPLFQQSDTETKSFNSSSFSPVLPTSAPSMTTTAASASPATSSAFSSTPSTIFGFGASTQSTGSTVFGSSTPSTGSVVFGASNGSTTASTTFASSSQNSKPIVFGATDNSGSQKPKAVVFGATDNNSSENSKLGVFGATGNNSSENSKPVVFGAIDNSSSHNSKPVVFGATGNNSSENSKPVTFGATVNNSSQNSKPVVFGATDNNSSQNSTTPIPFGTVTFGSGNSSNNSSQNSSMTAFGALSSNSSQNSSMTAFGASTTTTATANIPKPGSTTFGFGASDNNPQKPSAITFGATDNNNNIPANNGSSSAFGTQSTQSSTTQFGLFSSSSFGNSAFGSSASSTPSPFTSNVFGSSSQASAAPVFGSSTSSSSPFLFGSSGSGSGSGFTFGSSAPGSGSTPTPFTFNSSSASSTTPFTFNSSSSTTPTFGFGANSPNNDQMSVEDTMTDATNQAPTPTPTFPAFGQPQNPTASGPSFTFGSPAPAFSFGGAQNPPVQQQPFQPGGGLDFNPGGSFSLGSGGGADKSGRKIIKVKRGARGRK